MDRVLQNKLIFDLAGDFDAKLSGIAHHPMDRIIMLARRHGIDPDYLFWVLVDQKRQWPDLTRGRSAAVEVALELLKSDGEFPEKGLVLTPSIDVGPAIRDLSVWAEKNMSLAMAKIFTLLARKTYVAQFQNHFPQFGVAETLSYITQLIKEKASHDPGQFVNGVLIHRIFNHMW